MVAFFDYVCNLQAKVRVDHARRWIMQEEDEPHEKHDSIIKEIIELERRYFFEKRNVKTERQRNLREIIERHTNIKGVDDDS